MWSAIQWVTGGLTLVAFLAACGVAIHQRRIRSEQEILRGTDDARKAEVIEALRDRFRLPVDKLGKAEVFALAQRELARLADKDRQRVVVALAAMLALLAFAAIAYNMRRADEEAAKPAEAYVAIEYARLFGAIEVPILLQIQSTGEPRCQGEICNFSSEVAYPQVFPPGQAPRGHFEPKLAQFWRNNWPYRDSLVLSTGLWRSVAGNENYGLEALGRVNRNLGRCIKRILEPWLEGSGLESGPTNCRKEDTKVVGYLFLIVRNVSEKHLTDVALSYQELPRATPVGDYLLSLETDTRVIGARQQTLAGLKPKQSALLLLTVYEKDKAGFEKKFLDNGMLPREVSFKVDARAKALLVRSPRREKALVADLPFGWYLQ